MRLGTLLPILLLTAACGGTAAEPVAPAAQTVAAGAALAPYALGRGQVGHVLRYLEPPPGYAVTDFCLDGETERCDLVLDGVRWSSYTTMETPRGDWLLVGVVRHHSPAGAASALRGIRERTGDEATVDDIEPWAGVGGAQRERGQVDVSAGFRRGPWTVQLVGAATPARGAALRRVVARLAPQVLADLDADYDELLDRRRAG